jgi:hypothetical protein
MPLVMMVINSDCVAPGQERPNAQRGFRLAHEDAGRHVQRLGAADAHGQLHQASHGLDHDLHDAQVVEHGEEGGDKDDGGQHLEGDDEPIGGVLLAQLAKDEPGADKGIGQHAVHRVSGCGQGPFPGVKAQHQHGEDPLQPKSPGRRLPADGLSVGRKQPRQR